MAPRKSITGRCTGTKSIKPRNARKLIRVYHVLLKQRAQLAEQGLDTSSLDTELEQKQYWYQQASLSGQSIKRGGDSSTLLVDWLCSLYGESQCRSFRVLEIGSLSPDNALGKLCPTITRIDLNPQHNLIGKQDFLERPIPQDEAEKFDIISLSLVLNYVSTPKLRGIMLQRVKRFLAGIKGLFLVLPTPCIDNSRYLTRDYFQKIMNDLGYNIIKEKTTEKVSYWYFVQNHDAMVIMRKKKIINQGSGRNNFAITFESNEEKG